MKNLIIFLFAALSLLGYPVGSESLWLTWTDVSEAVGLNAEIVGVLRTLLGGSRRRFPIGLSLHEPRGNARASI